MRCVGGRARMGGATGLLLVMGLGHLSESSWLAKDTSLEALQEDSGRRQSVSKGSSGAAAANVEGEDTAVAGETSVTWRVSLQLSLVPKMDSILKESLGF